MFFKAGALSLILLLLSRVLGLLRESALAAAFGGSGMADVAIVMLTLPDWLAGVLASGALAYVLLPQWAREAPAQQNVSQRRVARRLLLLAVLLAALMWVGQAPLSALLVPGVSPSLRGAAAQAVAWSALALPAALLAGLWGTRLQHERDFAGLYSANLVVNAVVIGALFFLAWTGAGTGAGQILGASLLAAVSLRLLWQGARLRQACRHAPPGVAPAVADGPIAAVLPGWRIWTWAVLAAGLPLTLPFVARSLASGAGEGALATFNYAWKLVELPLVLAIQLVASLAFPAIASAHARQVASDGVDSGEMAGAVRAALVLAWTLACAAAAALVSGAPAIASLLFGWGRMQAPALEQIAAWGAAGAWGLLAQALIAVALTVLATLGRMRVAVLAYAVALAVLLLAGAAGLTAGRQLMWVLNAGFGLAALLAWLALGPAARRWVPVRALLAPFVALVAVALVMQWFGALASLGISVENLWQKQAVVLIWSALSAIIVIASGWFAGPHLRQALRS